MASSQRWLKLDSRRGSRISFRKSWSDDSSGSGVACGTETSGSTDVGRRSSKSLSGRG